MIDFVEFVVAELSGKRLSKQDALHLLQQYRLGAGDPRGADLHPLVQRNTSDLGELSYTTRLTGDEFFLRDHLVDARPVLPGVAYLEMARAAVVAAIPDTTAAGAPNGRAIEMRDIVWAQPIVVSTPTEVRITLLAGGAESDPIEFEIATDVVHSRGLVAFDAAPEPTRLDLAQLGARMRRGRVSADEVYAAYEKMGLRYGPTHRAVSHIEQGGGEVLARLTLPEEAGARSADYLLHPSLMDAAIQSAVGLIDDLALVPRRPALPFALDSLRILRGCTREMAVWVRYASGSKPGDRVTRLDFDLCDADGNVCVQMRGFTSRVLGVEPAGSAESAESVGTLYATPVWETRTSPAQPARVAADTQRYVVLCGFPPAARGDIEASIANCTCLSLTEPPSDDVATRYAAAAVTTFELIRKVLEGKPQLPVLVQLVASGAASSFVLGLAGLLKTATVENPALTGQILVMESGVTVSKAVERLESAAGERQIAIRYQEGARQVLTWQEVAPDDAPVTPYKDRGVYLITGGLGGLGLVFAQDIIAHTRAATIVLTGRTPLTAARKALLKSLASPDHGVEYRQMNLNSAEDVRRVVDEVSAGHRQLSGVIHAAGMLADAFILKKTCAQFREVLEPKVAGTFHLAAACEALPLDFFALFSAGASVTGNAGQADYAAANGFMDWFAAHCNAQVDAGHRLGRTVAINWPLWQEGGMRVDETTQTLLRDSAGLHPLTTAAGLAAFHRCLQWPQAQIQVVAGNLPQLRSVLLAAPAPEAAAFQSTGASMVAAVMPSVAEPVTRVSLPAGELQGKALEFLKRQLAPVLKLAPNKIDAAAPFEKYGIDSIMTMKLVAELEKTFGSLPKTLFFEYLTLAELTRYFVASHGAKLTALFEPASAAAAAAAAVAPARAPAPRQPRARRTIARDVVRAESPASEPIAIVGLSGRYPESPDIESFWRNLRDGKDCITEVPLSRWDWRKHYSEDRSEPGRHYSKWGGFIEGVDEFDPLFFNISPREARVIDPQERLFLQHAWMAVEDAGYTRASLQVPNKKGLAGQVGVYVGVMYGEYNLSGSLASIANRTSYVLNLHGPSLTLDTMCSSSLTAIHLACQDLKLGRTDLAIAGGVNVSIHPSKYQLLSAGQFISSDGHCQSFGEGGDGYIPGEGVGAVVLKRLSEAIAAGDHIYGVIKGSALNHGGKTNGYTVPNPQAQAAVIHEALVESNTNPRHISYLEAHGTGTKLGDPIEIASLNKAFGAQGGALPNGFCAIGSAKSNIGHCESAAGIAGLTKVLLQMRNRQIAPSLHSARLNPNIDFDHSPFVVNQSLRAWDRPVVDGRELARIAGISSFGAGGSNAHLIIEEYEAWPARPNDAPVIVPLSARTADQLERRARDLLEFLRANPVVDLQALAYTQQVGREPLEERMGFIASSAQELTELLRRHVEGEQDIDGVYRGATRDHRDTLALFAADGDLQETVDKWLARRNHPRLLELWVKGLPLDWDALYGEVKPRRIALPTYPFAREKYWIETVGQIVPDAPASAPAAVVAPALPAPGVAPSAAPVAQTLHPLLHTNTSDLREQRYTSMLSVDLPAIAYLEMARAAVDRAAPSRSESSMLELRQIAWGQPRVGLSEAATPVRIALFEQADEKISFEIYTPGESDDAAIVHCQGDAVYDDRQPATARLDVAQLEARTQRAEAPASHPIIGTIRRGNDELLASLVLPGAERGADYLLHPAMLAAALQAAGSLAGETGTPLALESLRIVFACMPEMLVWARRAQGRLDIDLCDPQGVVCVQLRGLTLHAPARIAALSLDDASVVHALAKPQAIQLLDVQAAEAPAAAGARSKPGVQLIGLEAVSAPEAQDVPADVEPAPEPEAEYGSTSDTDYPEEEIEAVAVPELPDAGVPATAALVSASALQQQLCTSLAEALYMDAKDIDIDKPFMELGLDSIVGVEWVKVINKKYALNVQATRVYDYPNIRDLATFLLGEIVTASATPSVVTPAVPAERVTTPKVSKPQGFTKAMSKVVAKPKTVQNQAPATTAKAAEPRARLSITTGAYPVLGRKARQGRAVASTPVPVPVAPPIAAPISRADQIAIVGMSGRYPQAPNLTQYWDNLAAGRNSVIEIPPSRWDVNQYYDPQPGKPDKVYCKWLGMLDDVDCFDPLFFRISPAEAANMDPQHRLFMQESYKAFEDAGYSNKTLSSAKCGVYLGIMSNEYSLLLSRGATGSVDTTGNSFAIGAARMAYYLNLKGPAIPIDTACSSSLVAIHLACQALQNREIDMALAGGVTLYLTPESYLGMCQAGMLSPDGQCKTFDNEANGFVPGEGVGAVILKRLEDAEADHDTIYGVILGSGINQDGKTNGITAPSVNSQIELERTLYARYGIDPASIDYVETHGTGTKLGDPIELEALATVFGEKTTKKNYCALGSVKSNIGHVSGAAGVASVQKVLLSMRHQTLVPTLNVRQENTLFDFKNSPFYICREKRTWDAPAGGRRRAAVSSFGFSGTNAHLVLEEYTPAGRAVAVSPPRPEFAVVLSARDPAQLRQKARDLHDFAQNAGRPLDLAALAYTLQVGRETFKERLGLAARSIEDLTAKLAGYLAGTPLQGVHQGQVGRDHDALAIFNDNADLRALAQQWLTSGKAASFLELWVKGLDVDWSSLYAAQDRPRRVSLPTYPFARERYWVAPAAAAAPALPSPVEVEPRRRQAFEFRWQPRALDPASSASQGVMLVLDSSAALCDELKRRHEGVGAVLVLPGAGFSEPAPDVFTVDPRSEADFVALVAGLKERGRLPTRIVQHAPSADFGIYPAFHLCKALLANKHPAARIVSCFSGETETAPHAAALTGFYRTLALENPHYVATTVDLGVRRAPAQIAALVLDELADRACAAEVRYGPARQVRELVASAAGAAAVELPLKQHGVYLVTGGLGGLGAIFCEYLLRNFSARLALLGRSAPGAELQARLAVLDPDGSRIAYLSCDVTDFAAVQRAVAQTKARFGAINGVIHAAGVTRDAFIIQKTAADLAAVLAPKVAGVENLDRATQAENLDLFVMFSSVAGALGNPGQCDYAYANRFLDAFAESRERLRSRQQRAGRTLSINWPFWAEGGMKLSAGELARTEAATGVSALPTQEGLEFWEELLRSERSQAMVLYGIPSKFQAHLRRMEPRAAAQAPAAVPAPQLDAPDLIAVAEDYLKRLIGAEIKLAAEHIDARMRFDEFGIDSIVVGRLNATLTTDLGELPKTLFYEYGSVDELARYLAGSVPQALARRWSGDAGVAPAAAPLASPPAAPAPIAVPLIESPAVVSASALPAAAEAIAIVGVHGCYPGSRDLDEYWENLREGRDLVGEVPASRWDADALFDADPAKARDGKIYCKWGAFLEDFDKFDAPFFNIPAEEARLIDPQERLVLSSVWSALEDAGYTRDGLRRAFPKAKSAAVGVYVGVTTNSYNLVAGEQTPGAQAVSASALPWSIANRVSYFFDLQGPSMPVDTACSSSLVALHLACESLRKGECQLAIAGGVNLYLHPSKYVSFCQRRMLATGGKTRSFGAGDDGFVPGEGVGTLILKPLSKALEQGDQIHAVIAASAFDHGGRSNNYSAPNPNSQSALIARTLRGANIQPGSIGYVEGHGTGTQLGDSLEVVALTQAFRGQAAVASCALGSVKGNLGHSESAAGMAAITKVLLQMKHKQLVPTLHSEQINPNIDFGGTPFHLQRALVAWDVPASQPRRALVNSFGAGGVNACVVMEEFTPSTTPRPAGHGPFLIAISAKNEERLAEAAERLLARLVKDTDVDLEALSYTLQVGREAMPERLACVVEDLRGLIENLDEWTTQKSCAGVLRGSLDPRRGAKRATPARQAELAAHFAARNLGEVASAWICGEEIDWELLWTRGRPRRVSLPTYPFARERHWIGEARAKPRGSSPLHPLIAYNSSTLNEVSFTSVLSSTEFYARDHQVNGQRIFPGSGFLEMACVSASIAGAKKVCRVQDVVWVQPLIMRGDRQLAQISLLPTDNGAEYVITSSDENCERVVHSEGTVLFQDAAVHDAPQGLDIDDLKRRCTRHHDGEHFYRLFAQAGIHYGPSFRTMQELHVADDFVLCRLSVADRRKDEFDEFILHPCIVDGALQAVCALIGGGEAPAPHLPFAIEEIEITRHTARNCYVHIERSGEKQINAEVKKFDIRIANEKGVVLVTFRNFCVRALRPAPTETKQS